MELVSRVLGTLLLITCVALHRRVLPGFESYVVNVMMAFAWWAAWFGGSAGPVSLGPDTPFRIAGLLVLASTVAYLLNVPVAR